MARAVGARRSSPPSRFGGTASLDQVLIVVLGALAVVLASAGAGQGGSQTLLAAGSLSGGLALVLLAFRSMELFVLVVLVVRPALDVFHAQGRSTSTDPATVVGFTFVAVSAVWLAARRLDGRRHPVSAAEIALVTFLAAAALATLGSDAPGTSVTELGRMLTATLMFFVVGRLCEQTGRPDRVLLAVVGAAVIPVGVALMGPFVGVERTEIKDRIERVVSTFAQSNPLGHFLAIALIVLVSYALTRRGKAQVVALVAAIPVAATLGLTYTRLAWGAAVLAVLVMAWVGRARVLVPAVAAVLLAAAALTPDIGHRLDQITAPNAAVEGSESGLGWRFGQWDEVLELGEANPITGIGPGVVEQRLSNRQPPHNDYLRAFVELGAVGLVTYLAVIACFVGIAVAALRRARGHRAQTVALAFAGVCTAFIVTSVAANLLGQVVILWYVVAVAAAAAYVGRHGRIEVGGPVTAASDRPRRARPAIAPA